MGDERDPPAADGQPPLGHVRMASEVDGTLGADAILSAKVTQVSEETTATTPEPVAHASDDDDDDDTDFAKWNRDEIQMELADLDESGERIERVANLFLMYNQTDQDHVSALCATWLREMKAADTHDRIPFLYVANHVIFKTKTSKSSPSTLFAETFRPLLPEAVSLVCTSPADRDTVVRILKLWAEQQLYPMDDIRGLWKETGEPLPPSWSETHAATPTTASAMDNMFATMDVEPDLPMGLKARAAHPLVDLLKRIDHAKHIVHHLEPKIQANHQYVLQSASSNGKVEACMQMIVIRNKYVKELLDLQKLVHVTAGKLLEDQVPATRVRATSIS
ncbi:hypothetical protein SPRG_08459 [Saprolegnia parasitica CBS 223.65]|uniref:CID domain-containing protein n=1 Tax=Saprolegnia parasitica (strain CBS 223.65) TaxID=695850 RepID=A0A067C6F7_SAPPC|nr:hypothetical protein SPRG_08459 [Saprolegnia parasitica CBS 223.65]KDO26098.1 hypothetical protein SPRG_08459 [Saprolegnia parasitica CBS 223.65]|eukprot:XP_012203094.1 hypothetical protein SPRG_08459 [Saprolegnia parasitica CBS 223.65]